MPLDPQIRMMLDQIEALGAPPMWEMSVAEARASIETMVMMMGPGEEVASVEDRTIDVGDRQLPIRVYRPDGLGDGPAPALVFYHGGGFVIGSLVTHDGDCRALANRGECVVVAVDYRLAPEHPYPAAVEDAWAALAWVAEHGREIGVDPARLAVGGDSAGGNLAAVTALWARDQGIDLRLQLLIYPATDAAGHDYPSRTENAQGYMLDAEAMDWFMGHYLHADHPVDWRLAPMRAERHDGLAPALVITAEFDPLRDEGEAYGAKLAAAGVTSTVRRYDGMIHGFFGMGALVPSAKPAVDEAGAILRDALHA